MNEKGLYSGLITLFTLLSIVSPIIAQGNPWTTKTDMLTARVWFSCEAVDGKIYAIGGGTVSGAPTLATVVEYDPVNDTWTSKQDMPTARRSMYSAVADGKIYIIGGDRNLIIGQTNGVRTVEVYDPTNDTRDTQKADMPTAREGGSASAVNSIIYVMGGVKPGGVASNEVEAYDPATDTWATKNPMPAARWALSTAVVDGKIYAMGGFIPGGQGLRIVEVYDPSTDTWTTKAFMPVRNGYFGTGIVNGIIYTIGGGLDPFNPYLRVFAYDPSTDAWSEKTPMPTPRFTLGASAVSQKIYTIGGSPGWPPSPLAIVEEYDPTSDPTSVKNLFSNQYLTKI